MLLSSKADEKRNFNISKMSRFFSSFGFQLSSSDPWYDNEPTDNLSHVSTHMGDHSTVISPMPILTENQQPLPTHSTMHIDLPEPPLTAQPVCSPPSYLTPLSLTSSLSYHFSITNNHVPISRPSTRACHSPPPQHLQSNSLCAAAPDTTRTAAQDTIPTSIANPNSTNANPSTAINDRVIMEEEGGITGILSICRCSNRENKRRL